MNQRSEELALDYLERNGAGSAFAVEPAFHPEVHTTLGGVKYVQKSGVVLVSYPQTCLGNIRPFLAGLGEEYVQYADDEAIEPGAEIAKFAGQMCYLSLGEKRTKNRDAGKYFQNIKAQSHGSITEHSNYGFLIYGISRSCSHEIVRHRHQGFSQLSQRYVGPEALRFVERPEFQNDPFLHERFQNRIEDTIDEYRLLIHNLYKKQADGSLELSADRKTDLRKKVQQTARAVLPNEVETMMVTTANVRAWRHFIEQRASEHAEVEIRDVAVKVFLALVKFTPLLFDDYDLVELSDGTLAVSTPYRKI